MQVCSINTEVANSIWNARMENEELHLDERKIEKIGPDDADLLSDLELDDLREKLTEIQAKFPRNISKGTGGKIDAALPEIVHSELKDLIDTHQASHIGFWRWLSNVACEGYFWNFINWRFKEGAMINWGITGPGSIVEVYFYRAWLRGHKMYEPVALDPYKYARLGASDMWRSQILRQDFGRDKEFVKAFLDTVYDKSGNSQVGTTELRKKLIPALRAWTSAASFAHLSYNESVKLIENLRKIGI